MRAIKLLELHKMVSVTRQKRKANVYSLTNPSSWVKNPHVDDAEKREHWELPLPESYYMEHMGEVVEIPPYPEFTSLVNVDFATGKITEVGREYIQ